MKYIFNFNAYNLIIDCKTKYPYSRRQKRKGEKSIEEDTEENKAKHTFLLT